MAGLGSFKQAATLVIAMMVVGFGSSVNALANDLPSSQGKSIVALGDSITFGYNLDDTVGNTIPSPSSFPEFIGKSDDFSVSNLGVPGWTTKDLLHAMQTPDYVRALQGASVITLDIGSNDLIQVAGEAGLLQLAFSQTPVKLSDEQQQLLESKATQVGQNLGAIISSIRTKTDAPILLYNLYNPFPDTSVLHIPGEQFENIANLATQTITKTTPGVLYMDAHHAFDHNQPAYVRIAQGDIHPTVQGQEILANLGESAIAPILTTLKEKANVSVDQVAGHIESSGGTINAHLWDNSILLDIPQNALANSSEIDVTSTALPGLATIVPANEKVVAEASVHFESDVKMAKPYMLTIRNSDIVSGGSVYQVVGNKFAFIPGAKVTQGKAVIPSTAEGDFVVVEPTTTFVPGATRPETGFPALIDGGIAFILLGVGGSLMYAGRNKRHS